MNLIDEQQDVSGFRHLCKHLLDALLKFTPVLRACHNPGKIQGDHSFSKHRIRNHSAHNALCNSLYNRRFSYAGFSDQARIVLASPA